MSSFRGVRDDVSRIEVTSVVVLSRDGRDMKGVDVQRGVPEKVAELDPSALPKAQQQRRQRVVDAASELLLSNEFENIQIRDVAERSGVALGTVYRYFTSKEHLYAAVMADWSAADPIKRGEKADMNLVPAERIRSRLHCTVDRLHEFPTFLRLQSVLRQSTDPTVLGLFLGFSDQAVRSYRAVLSDLEPDDAADIIRISTSVLAHEMELYGLGRREISEVHRLVDRMVDMIFSSRSIASAGPREAVNE
ncbi:TetR/AcrR family transcriptional regulator [Rhodococcus qingshengii]|uniref:TetR/AcrR family transcriptional regulator n=1 Tax=Rhodococcus qingshengii TaxID=334542 RepID=UPI0037CAFCFC